LAAAKKGEIAVGNVIGSNIANVLLGLVALASATRSRRRARRYRPLAPVHAGHLRRGRRPRAVAHGTLRRRRAADALRAVLGADGGAVADIVAAHVPPLAASRTAPAGASRAAAIPIESQRNCGVTARRASAFSESCYEPKFDTCNRRFHREIIFNSWLKPGLGRP